MGGTDVDAIAIGRERKDWKSGKAVHKLSRAGVLRGRAMAVRDT